MNTLDPDDKMLRATRETQGQPMDDRAAVSALSSSPVGEMKYEPGTIRVCPMRDATCPHGLNCPYTDGYDCKPGWQSPRSSPQGVR